MHKPPSADGPSVAALIGERSACGDITNERETSEKLALISAFSYVSLVFHTRLVDVFHFLLYCIYTERSN
jgi:hypothetical protein